MYLCTNENRTTWLHAYNSTPHLQGAQKPLKKKPPTEKRKHVRARSGGCTYCALGAEARDVFAVSQRRSPMPCPVDWTDCCRCRHYRTRARPSVRRSAWLGSLARPRAPRCVAFALRCNALPPPRVGVRRGSVLCCPVLFTGLRVKRPTQPHPTHPHQPAHRC